MSSSASRRSWLRLAAAAVSTLLALLLPPAATAHSELVSANPADGSSVASPFSGPIVLTFSEHLADGSRADLVAANGSVVASATLHAAAPSLTFALGSPLAPGAYQVKWTSIADDGDLLRGIVTFSVAGAAGPAASPTTSGDAGGASDVVLPIAIVLLVAAAGAFYLFRRNRPA